MRRALLLAVHATAAAALFAGVTAPASADLYRWVESSGSVRYSSYPPPGFDPANPDPRVQVLPDPRRPPETPAETPVRAAAGTGNTAAAGAVAGAATGAPASDRGGAPPPAPSVKDLLGARAELIRALLPHAGIDNPAVLPESVHQQLTMLGSLRGVLNQVDPAGAADRAKEESAQLGALIKVAPAPQAVRIPAPLPAGVPATPR